MYALLSMWKINDNDESSSISSLKIKQLLLPTLNDVPLLLQVTQESHSLPNDKNSKESFTLVFPLLKSILIGQRSLFPHCVEIVLKKLGDHISTMKKYDAGQ